MNKEVYSNCYTCGEELVEGQEIVTVHQYYYCDKGCLEMDIKRITLGSQSDNV